MELIILIPLALHVALAAWVAACADNKGRSGGAYFFLALIFTPLFMGLVVACIGTDEAELRRRDMVRNPQAYDPAQQERMALLSGDFKKCPDCAELIRADARRCRHCGVALGEPVGAFDPDR